MRAAGPAAKAARGVEAAGGPSGIASLGGLEPDDRNRDKD